MAEFSDMELVRAYARHDSEAAFAELVQRHIGLVYSAALRHAGVAAQAEEITQAVFIILARKAGNLHPHAVLKAWLYETTRWTALSYLRAERRRQFREQEAYMQTILQESPPDNPWREMAPLLDDAMMRLGGKERQAIVLRYFHGQSLREAAAGLDISEAAAQKRVNRALEKLRKFFSQRDLDSSTAIIAGAISANSVHAAPAMLINTVTAAAIAKGMAASTSTLTLIKGALKIMAWTKAKTTTIACAGVLLAVGTTTVAIEKINHREPAVDDSYFVTDSQKIFSLPPNILIFRQSHFSSNRGGLTANRGAFGQKQESRLVCAGQLLPDILAFVYEVSPIRVMLPPDAPTGRFDCLATLPATSQEQQCQHVQDEIARQFGLVGHREKRVVDVLLLKVKSPHAPVLQPHTGNSMSVDTKAGTTYLNGQTMDVLAHFTEYALKQVVEDRTGLTGRYDYTLDAKLFDVFDGISDRAAIEKTLLDDFGLELVPSREPVEMLVVEKVK